MPDEPVVVVGAGFVPMIPGTWANTTIQPPQAEIASIPSEDEASTPESSPPQKSSPSKSPSPSKEAPGV